MTDPADTPDLAVVKQVQQHIWSEGDFAVIATILQGVSENLAEAADLPADEQVLDVACGSGNMAIAAARRFTVVTGVDYVPSLLERGRERAAAEGVKIDFREGDAEALPFEDASFDVVLRSSARCSRPTSARRPPSYCGCAGPEGGSR